jgi:hypothetical protein
MSHAQSPGAGTWSFDGNGYLTTLTLHVDSANNVAGTIYNGDSVTGFFTPSSHRIVFYRNLYNKNVLNQIQVYTGYIFPNDVHNPSGAAAMAGTFQVFSGTGGTAVSNEYGWSAYRSPTIVVH